MSQPMHLHRKGPPETALPEDPAQPALDAARELTDPVAQRRALVEVAARHPRSCAAWAELAALANDPVDAYAYARVGYHRGLDQLRQAGWRGSGYVRWAEPTNHGFLRSLDALRRAAAAIGEDEEETRCAEFLMQLDPGGPWNRD